MKLLCPTQALLRYCSRMAIALAKFSQTRGIARFGGPVFLPQDRVTCGPCLRFVTGINHG